MKHEAFYSAAAQVIPVIGLALIFQTGLFREALSDYDPRLTVIGLVAFVIALVLLVGAEAAALKAHYSGGTTLRNGLIALCLLVSVAWFVTLPLLEAAIRGVPRNDPRWSGRMRLGIVAVAVVILITNLASIWLI